LVGVKQYKKGGKDMEKITKKKKRVEYIPGQLLIRIRDETIRPALGTTRLKMSVSESSRLPEVAAKPISYLKENAGLKVVSPLFSKRRTRIKGLRGRREDVQKLSVLSSVHDSESEELAGISVLSLSPRKVTKELMSYLRSSKAVEIIEPMPARWLASQIPDPELNLQWGLRTIQWFGASIPDASKVLVAVLDTGVDAKHPDLKNVDVSYDHKGLKADDIVGHGTHVAGIIAATVNNNVGIAGVAVCQLGIWKIFPDKPIYGEFYVDGERYLQALNAVIQSGAKVVNLSIGGTASSETEELLFRRLTTRGIVVVAAMGNEYLSGNPPEYPAAYPDVIAVGAVAETRCRASFSNTGQHITLVAPGVNILSTLPRKKSPYRDETDYAAWSGTSMATPHVSGAVTLLIAKHSGLSPKQVTTRLQRTATHLPIMKKKKWTSQYGSGLLNIKKLL